MRKNMKIRITILSLILSIITLFSFGFNNAYADTTTVYLGGMSAGFSLNTKGAEVIGVCDVITENGLISPCKDADILVGEVIIKIK